MRKGSAIGLAIACLAGTTLLAGAAGQTTGGGFLPTAEPPPAEVWAVGDGADGSALSISVAEMIEDRTPDRFLYLGDVYDSGTADEFERNYDPVYGRFKAITAPTPGNHEWGNRAVGYWPYWRAVTGERIPKWYAREAGRWQLLSLNSEVAHGSGSKQIRWLRKRLRRSEEFGNCRIAFFHRPRYSAGNHGDSEDLEPIWEALAHRTRIVLGGHDHDMQRFRPERGMVQLVSGAGGYSMREVDESDPRLRFAEDYVAGALRLRLRPKRASYAFVSAAGEVLDSGTRRCKRA